jgi:hypothetical protein
VLAHLGQYFGLADRTRRDIAMVGALDDGSIDEGVFDLLRDGAVRVDRQPVHCRTVRQRGNDSVGPRRVDDARHRRTRTAQP